MTRIDDDDAGMAMASVLIAILLTAGLSILVLGMLVSQLLPTQFMRASSQTVFAAEAGTNAVIGQIRTAEKPPDSSGAVYGDRTLLPCSAQGPVGDAAAGLSYAATVRYFSADPAGHDETWRQANAIPCTPGAGPAIDPDYAVITSEGTGQPVAGLPAGAGNRTVSVIYEFRVTNVNVPGGLIYSFDDRYSPDRYCLEAYSATNGSLVRYVPAAECGTDDVLQLWTYDTDYQIKLASSTMPGSATGPLCFTGPVTASQKERIVLRPCLGDTDPARWNQLWSWEGGARWKGQLPDNSNYASTFLSSSKTSGDPRGEDVWVTGNASVNREWGSYNPDPRVGAGAAGAATHQVVNYLEFGRCFDVTEKNVNSEIMIVYPCKQDPSGGTRLEWNHKWYYDEPAVGAPSAGPQTISVLKDNSTTQRYCLISPGTEGGYVKLTKDCSLAATNQRWMRFGDTGEYASSYTFVDNWGRCISLGPKYLDAWSTMVTATCTGTLNQKWNAPPGTVAASLEGYRELP